MAESSKWQSNPYSEDTESEFFPVHGERYVTYQMWDLYPSWHKQAKCIGVKDTLFFGATDQATMPPYNLGDIKQAKAMCGGCPVAGLCLRSALENREGYGVWGGTTSKQRRKMLAAVDAGLITIDKIVEAFTIQGGSHV